MRDREITDVSTPDCLACDDALRDIKKARQEIVPAVLFSVVFGDRVML